MSAGAALLRGTGRGLVQGLVAVVVLLTLWVAFLELLDVSPYVGKGPLDVYRFLFVGDDAAADRAEVLRMLGVTLGDAALGFVSGLVAAVVLACLVVSSRGVAGTVMPVAMLLRSVPLIAMTPVLSMALGRGTVTVAVIGGIVVLFPALVSMVFGLRSASPLMHDVVAVYGGSRWAALRLVDLPSSLPAFFASVRISVPGAITGALIAEWLATGQGIGYGVVSALGRAQNDKVWALVVVVTVVSLVLYTLAQAVESIVLRPVTGSSVDRSRRGS